MVVPLVHNVSKLILVTSISSVASILLAITPRTILISPWVQSSIQNILTKGVGGGSDPVLNVFKRYLYDNPRKIVRCQPSPCKNQLLFVIRAQVYVESDMVHLQYMNSCISRPSLRVDCMPVARQKVHRPTTGLKHTKGSS